MKQSRIEEIVAVYFPEKEWSNDVRELARISCENVERETSQEIANYVHELLYKVNTSPKESDKEPVN